MDTSRHLLPHPSDSFLPCVLLRLSNLCLYNRPHPDIHHDPLLVHDLLLNCDNRLYHGRNGVGG